MTLPESARGVSMLELHKLKIGDAVPRGDLESLLTSLAYQKKDFVAVPGEFAFRGATVDIYPVTYRVPVRLDFELDTVSSIKDFSLTDGKSTARFDEVCLVPKSEVFGKKVSRLRQRFQLYESLTETRDLAFGDYVVHKDYGIGRFLGSKRIKLRGGVKRCLAIEYAGREILYLDPGEALERYIGGEGTAPKLTKLHTKEWERIQERTRCAVRSIARDMLELQAKRSLSAGYGFPADTEWQKEFESQFPFEETPDQTRAAEEVKRDMENGRPMDRLLCGDVGYGKTEVAMRAAFKAVMAGKQVSILVPTTVLAEQHYLVFRKRLKNFPVSVEVLSRFRTRKEQLRILESVKTGKTDIVIGTHLLANRAVCFRDLGLMIIDEEQRFGVSHKEKLKHLRASVDVLTLTATPIPRTLYMSLMGVRDMSVINSPPKNRMPVETYVLDFDEARMREAVDRELKRGGQVYFIHNRVQSIDKMQQKLTAMMPHVGFGVAHGQMPAAMLETVMLGFLEKRIDCLIATNIIESGIDIPNVNTIIVNRADQFGLADLYQLRGRVGRYHEKRQAYAYFFLPKNWVLSQDAQKRLTALERFTDLGSGFKIALEDLQIRGAGNLLGHEQSGFIHSVGFDLYCRMLRKAVEEQKKQSGQTA